MDSFWLTLAKIVTLNKYGFYIIFANCISNNFKLQVMIELTNSIFFSVLIIKHTFAFWGSFLFLTRKDVSES